MRAGAFLSLSIGVALGGVGFAAGQDLYDEAEVPVFPLEFCPANACRLLRNNYQADPWAGLIRVCEVLSSTPVAQLPDKLESVLNVDCALWVCAFGTAFQNDDEYGGNRSSDYSLYYERETGGMHLLPYDGSESMRTNAAGWPIFYRADDPGAPIMRRLMAIPQYRQRYLAHVRTILDSLLAEEGLPAKLNACRASVLADPEVGRTVPRILDVALETTRREAGQTVTVTAHLSDAVAVCCLQLFVAPGPFAPFTPMPMSDAGHVGEGESAEHLFSVTLPDYPAGTVLRYYVQAMTDDGVGTVAFDPPRAEYEVYTHVVTYPHAASSAVVINEVMAKNRSAVTDPQNEHDDWIELKNVSDQPLDLSGMYLSDNLIHPLKWQFPQGTQLGPGGYLIVWADEDGADAPGLHANFKLSPDGETVWLYDTAAHGYTLLDSVTFENLATDQPFGRYPDGTGPAQILSTPSPLGTNAAPAASGNR